MTPQQWQERLDSLFPKGCVVSWMGPGDDYGDDNVHTMHVPRIIVLGSGETEGGSPDSVELWIHGPDGSKVSQPVVESIEPYTEGTAPKDAMVMRGPRPMFYVVSGELTRSMRKQLAAFRSDPEWAEEFVSPVIPEESAA